MALLPILLALGAAHAGAPDVPARGVDGYEITRAFTGRFGGGAAGLVLGGGAGVIAGAGVALTAGAVVGSAEEARCRGAAAAGRGVCTDAMNGGQAMLAVGAFSLPIGAVAGALVGAFVGAALVDGEPPPPREHLY